MSEKTLEEKYIEWFNKTWNGHSDPSYREAFKAGYKLARQEMQEKLEKLNSKFSYHKNGRQIKEIYIDEYKMIELQEKLDEAIKVIEHLHLYAKINHDKPKDYLEVIEDFLKERGE